jgi:GNAT superfamily N-acetyltransferase
VTLTVRSAGAADAEPLVQLVHAAFADYEGRLTPPSGAHAETAETIRERLEQGALVAEADAGPVGCLFYRDQGRDLYIGRLAVLPSWRGRGVGKMLMESAAELGRDRGVEALVVGVRLQLPENIGFFASLGFRPFDVGTHDGFRHPTFLWMRRPLA